MKVLVTGSRYWTHKGMIYNTLDEIHAKTPITLLIHGCAKGADTIADEWASERGVEMDLYPARWSEFGRIAGSLRNQEMIDKHPDTDLCVGFPITTSVGTRDCLRRAEKAGIKTLVIECVK